MTSQKGNINKTLITFDWRLQEPNGVHFWGLGFFDFLGAEIVFFDKKIYFLVFSKIGSYSQMEYIFGGYIFFKFQSL